MDDIADIMAFADIRAAAGHTQRFVFDDGTRHGQRRFLFGGEPDTLEEIQLLVYVGGQSFN